MTLQEQLQQIMNQAKQVAQSVASISPSISPELQKNYQTLYGETLKPSTPSVQTTQVAPSVQTTQQVTQPAQKTSSSFDYLSGLTQNIISQNVSPLQTETQKQIQDLINVYKSQISPSQIQEGMQTAKQSLELKKQASIEQAKQDLDLYTRQQLSKYGLLPAIGSGVVDVFQNIQAKNVAAINNLAAQYDTAIANLDLQEAQAIREELNNLINLQLNLSQLQNQQSSQAFNVATSLYQIDLQNAQNILKTISETYSGTDFNSLPSSIQKSISDIAYKLANNFGTSPQAMLDVISKTIENPEASQIIQYQNPNTGEAGYVVLDKNFNQIKKQVLVPGGSSFNMDPTRIPDSMIDAFIDQSLDLIFPKNK